MKAAESSNTANSAMQKTGRRRLWVSLAIMIAVSLLIISVVLVNHNPKNTKLVCSTPTGQMLSTDTLNFLASKQFDEAQNRLTQLQDIKMYDQDPNCLYTEVSFYLATSDLTKAQASFTKLQGVYDTKEGYRPPLKGQTKSMAKLQSELKLLQTNVDEAKKNSYGVPL